MRALPRRILFHKGGRLRGIFRRLMATRIGQSDLLRRIVFEPLPQDDRPVVLVICHEASRTGAPILGWNIIRRLSPKYRVVSVLLRGGELEREFRAAAAASTLPLTWAMRSPAAVQRAAQSLVSTYGPVYAIANSIETNALVPALTRLGVPVIALVHEFASYTRPMSKLSSVFYWASDIVFPARMVAESSFQQFPELKDRAGIHLLAQGRSEIPRSAQPANTQARIEAPLRPSTRRDAFVILGAGTVQLRKGVEAFVSTAAAARRLRPDLDLLFVWIGDGFDPERDLSYSVYLDEQIKRSDLGDSLIMRDAVEDLDSLYRQADVFLLSSRLDPQPNVAIDAMTYGIPTVCFEGGAGTAEILAADPTTRDLVVPYLDTQAAAEVICRLADRRESLDTLGAEVARVADAAFDMQSYVDHLDEFGRMAAARANPEDLRILVESGVVDPAFLLNPHEERLPSPELEWAAMARWQLWNGIAAVRRGADVSAAYRRACAGFNPTIYALAHPEECIEGVHDPLAHWIAAGRPRGTWCRPVHLPLTAPIEPVSGPTGRLRIVLHGHFYYPELIGDLLKRLGANKMRVDLFLTTDTEAKAAQLTSATDSYDGVVRIEVTPNRGRDIGPFLTGVMTEILQGNYDVVGHVHAKRSLAMDAAIGERWRNFLWENLVGGQFAMVDRAATAFAANPLLGLLMAEDPNIVGWGHNRAAGEKLAARVGLAQPLPSFLDFPLGTMFWARPAALAPLIGIGLVWDDYPAEPVPNDGTILHAIERILPGVVQHAGFEVEGLRVPNTSW